VDEGHGGGGHAGMEGMDMAEEMGIFIVNIASMQPGKAIPLPGKNSTAPIPLNPKPANPSASSAPKFGGAPSGHSHGGRSLQVRSLRNGMLMDLPEEAEWIYL
jgi:hypothetical protein